VLVEAAARRADHLGAGFDPVIDRPDAFSGADHQDHVGLGARTHPEEVLRVIAHLLRRQELVDHRVVERGNHVMALLRHDVVGIVHALRPARARHVLDDDGGLAGDEFLQVSGEQLPVFIVDASRAVRDEDRYGLLAVVLRNPVRPGRARRGACARRREAEDGEGRLFAECHKKFSCQ